MVDNSDRRVDCDVATRVPNASYHLAVVASDVLLNSELSERLIDRAWPSLSHFLRLTSDHHSSVSDSPDILNGGDTGFSRTAVGQPTEAHAVLESVEPRASCALRRVHVLVFLRSALLTVWSGSGTTGKLVQRLLRLFLTVEECSEEMSLWSPRSPPAWSWS